MTTLNLEAIREEFPALKRELDGRPLIYFDAPGGTQMTRRCLDRIVDYLTRCNANTHGAFVTAVESDAIIAEAHEAAADFLNARSADEIVFGQNMTSLTFAVSRSLGQWLKEGDEIILTRLDHDANYSPWHLIAMERGVKVNVVDINPDDCTLLMGDFERFLGPRTKLVAVGYVSNAVGTINPVARIVRMAHAAGALTFIDAVAAAPHLPIDVQDLDTDFLVCSPYKFWGPHQGFLYGKYDLLDRLPAHKVRPAEDKPPHKFQTGTQSFENQAGLIGVMEYLEWFGESAVPALELHGGARLPSSPDSPASDDSRARQESRPTGGQVQGIKPGTASENSLRDSAKCRTWRSPRSARLHYAMRASQLYEQELISYLIEHILAIDGVRFFGIRERGRVSERAPTVAIRYKDEHPRATAERLARAGICVWDGNYYAINLSECLGVESTGGMVRVGLTHYNTRDEINRLLAALVR
ncbi:MAG: aminotransferase class V-fold PLP-dependent enzyme [Verrucomicrobia bacterium]|nr:aminotransferase class V-fold PLP-dependent enzyme [Verrucomicrobiota bacterium]